MIRMLVINLKADFVIEAAHTYIDLFELSRCIKQIINNMKSGLNVK